MTILNDADVRDGIRYFTATVDGVRYEIPEMWAIGYCTTHGGSAIEAAEAWHLQSVIEKTNKEARRSGEINGAMLRRFSTYGPCIPVGRVISHTDKTVTVQQTIGRGIKRLGGYDWNGMGREGANEFTKPLGHNTLHTVPCPSCEDHPHTQYHNGYQD